MTWLRHYWDWLGRITVTVRWPKEKADWYPDGGIEH